MQCKATWIVGPCTGVLLVLGLAACGTPTEYRHPGEIPEGPGVFTGEAGAIRFSTDRNEPGDGADDVSADAAANMAAGDDCGCPDTGELEDYRRFLRWKAEAIGTPEYREFEDWRQWRLQGRE